MKLLLVLLFLFPFSLTASEIICTDENLQLNISVKDSFVFWTIKVIDNVDVAISGSGNWQKESESQDAFSSFDDVSAISYKNQRAVFVMGNDQSIYFSECKL